MNNEKVFRIASIGGYNKTDVVNYVEEMEKTLNEVREECEYKTKKLHDELTNMKKKYKGVVAEKDELEKEIEDFLLSKEALVKMELEAHLRAKEILAQAEEDADKIISSANNACKVELIANVEESKKIQLKIEDLTKEFMQKNLEIKDYISRLHSSVNQEIVPMRDEEEEY